MPTVTRSPLESNLKYRRAAVLAVREASRAGIFKREGVTNDQKLVILTALGTKIIEAYNVGRDTPIESATVEINAETVADHAARGGFYNPVSRQIVIDKPSMVTFLHELGHHIQTQRDGHTDEPFARAWSIGLFRKAVPGIFAEAVRTGRVWYT